MVAGCQVRLGPSPGVAAVLLGAECAGTVTAPALLAPLLLPAPQVCTALSAAADRAWQEAGVPPSRSEGAPTWSVPHLPLQMRGLLFNSPGAAVGAAGAAAPGCVAAALPLSNAPELPPGGALMHCIARARGPGRGTRRGLRLQSQGCHAGVSPVWLWSFCPLAHQGAVPEPDGAPAGCLPRSGQPAGPRFDKGRVAGSLWGSGGFAGANVRLQGLSKTAFRPGTGRAGCCFLGPCLALGLSRRL